MRLNRSLPFAAFRIESASKTVNNNWDAIPAGAQGIRKEVQDLLLLRRIAMHSEMGNNNGSPGVVYVYTHAAYICVDTHTQACKHSLPATRAMKCY